MNKIFILLFIFSSLFTCKNNIPEDSSLNIKSTQPIVLDYAKLFTESQTDSLSNKIIAYELFTTNEIAIITQDSIPTGENIQIYATQIANQLGVGKKTKDNGLLILVSTYDRQVSIATGYGTEKMITDYICKGIIDSIMIPNFKNGKYYLGVDTALDTLISKWH